MVTTKYTFNVKIWACSVEELKKTFLNFKSMN